MSKGGSPFQVVVSDGPKPKPASPARMVVELSDGERVHPLLGRQITIGRDPTNGICIAHHFVSQFHAKLIQSGSIFTIVDLGSVNKTRVNGRLVVTSPVTYGDEIEFAGVTCRLLEPETESASAGPAPPVKRDLDAPAPSQKKEPRRSISPLFLAGGVLLLFALLAAIVSRVC